MTVFLTSSPYRENTDRAMLNPANGFLRRLRRELPAAPRALFVCADPMDHEGTENWASETSRAFAEAGIPFSETAFLDGTTADFADFLVGGADLILISGGHLPTQNAFFRELGLKELLRDFPGVVMGISAGSMDLAEWVYVIPEEPGEVSDPDFQRWVPGLGIADVNIMPHFQKSRDYCVDGARILEDVVCPDSMDNPIFALADGSYLIQKGSRVRLYGPGWLIWNGHCIRLTKSGQSLDLDSLHLGENEF